MDPLLGSSAGQSARLLSGRSRVQVSPEKEKKEDEKEKTPNLERRGETVAKRIPRSSDPDCGRDPAIPS